MLLYFLDATTFRVEIQKHFLCFFGSNEKFREFAFEINWPLTETTVDVALSRSRYLFFCYHIGQNDHFSRGTPSAPLDLKAAIVSSRFVTLSWSPPKTSKEPLNGYSIYYKQVKNFVQPFISLASVSVRSAVKHLQPNLNNLIFTQHWRSK